MRLHLYRPQWAFMLAVALMSSGAAIATAEEKPAAPAAPSPAATPERPKAPEPPARAPRAGDIQRVFTIEHARVADLANVLAIFPVNIKTSDRPRAIGVSGPPAVVAAIEETIKRLDVPPPPARDIEVTGYVIKAQRKSAEPDDVPEGLASTVSQMRSLFGYGRFELLDVLVGRGAATKARIELSALAAKRLQMGVTPIYVLSARPELASQGAGVPTIRIGELRFEMKVPVAQAFSEGPAGFSAPRSYSYQDVGINADIEVRPEQYVVVGKTGLGDDSGDALILVIKARLVD